MGVEKTESDDKKSVSKLERAFLVGVQTPDMAEGEGDRLLAELRELVGNLRLKVTSAVLAKLRARSPALLLGSSKGEEIMPRWREPMTPA